MRLICFFVCILIFTACKKSTDNSSSNSGPTLPSTTTPQFSMSWQKALGGSGIDILNSCAPTPDGGCIVTGQTTSNDGDVTGLHSKSDIWIVKLSSSGSIEWQKALGGSGSEDAYSIIATSDGGYALTGWTTSTDGDAGSGFHGGNFADLWIVKLNSSGNIVWQKILGGSMGDYGRSIIEIPGGGFVVAGYTLSNDGDVSGHHGLQDAWIIKLENNGSIAWKKTIGGTNIDHAFSIIATSDGGYILAGASKSNDGDVSGNHGDLDFWIVKLNSAGNMSWQKSLGGSGRDIANSIVATADGSYLICGETESNNEDVSGNHGGIDAWLVKLTNNGTITWKKTVGGPSNEGANSITTAQADNYVIGGTVVEDFWTVKVGADGNMIEQKYFGGTAFDAASAVIKTTDDRFIAVGMAASNNGYITGYHGGNYDGWAVKFKF